MINLQKYNKHWNEGFRYGFEKRRDLFEKLASLAKKKQIIAITGLRRTGKTVLMKQLIDQLLSEGVERRRIFYFSFDEEKPKIDDLLAEFIAATDIDLDKEKIYLFLDEIQKLDEWQEQVKVLYDNNQNVKIFVSGSSSLFIRKRATESLAGRIFILELPVLSFSEFLKFRGKENLLRQPKMFSDELKRELLRYMRRSFIEIIDEDDETAAFYMESILNKIVYEDIPALFPVESPDKLKAIVKAVYSVPGIIIQYEALGNDLGLSSKTVEKYVYYLLQSKLIKKIYNFSRNFLTSEKKLKKFYVTAPCFCFLNPECDVSKVAENVVALDAGFFWRDPFKHEVDFVFRDTKQLLPAEVKFRQSIKSEDTHSLELFMEKFGAQSGVLITKDCEKEGKISFIPLWKWLLNCYHV